MSLAESARTSLMESELRHPDWQWKWVIWGPVTFAFDARLAELMKQSQPAASEPWS